MYIYSIALLHNPRLWKESQTHSVWQDAESGHASTLWSALAQSRTPYHFSFQGLQPKSKEGCCLPSPLAAFAPSGSNISHNGAQKSVMATIHYLIVKVVLELWEGRVTDMLTRVIGKHLFVCFALIFSFSLSSRLSASSPSQSSGYGL